MFFHSYSALDNHIGRIHSKSRHVPQVLTVSSQCPVHDCSSRFDSWRQLCYHIIKDHHQKEGITTPCPFSKVCQSTTFFKESTFRVHLSQKHKGWTSGVETPNQWVRTNVPDVPDVTDVDISMTEDLGCDQENEYIAMDVDTPKSGQEEFSDKYDVIHDLQNDFYHKLASFYMKLESQHFVPVSTIQEIARGLAQLTEDSLNIVKIATKRELEFLNVPDSLKETAVNNIISSDCLYAAHHKDTMGPKMITNALRKKYYRENFKYTKPISINLSKDANNPRCIYYVSMKESLELQLSKPEIQKEIEDSFVRPENEDEILHDYQDGSLYKRLVQREPGRKYIDLIIFQDAFTATKDLSSVANDYQILGMCMCMGNLRPHLRSKIDCMQLIMLIPDFKSMFHEFKMRCFKKVLKALKNLEKTGISFMGKNLGVRLLYVVGDNKGQHELGGFIQSFSAEYYCRFCPMTKTDILLEPWKVAPLRTAAQYEDASNSVPPDRATYMGVSRPDYLCPFNELINFHVCDPRLAPRVGHDLVEGVIDYDLSQILQLFVKEKNWFSYELLNRRIRSFQFKDQDLRNKPAPVRYDKKKKTIIISDPKLGGYAVQNWTLLRLLPFILGEDLIQDTDDPCWKLYLSLKEITEYVCASSISTAQLSRLKIILEDYAASRQDLLEAGKCKHYYIQHYPDLIEIMGPVILLMTLRFESFHQFFKRAIRSGNNFINLGTSLAKKYCLYLAYLSTGSLFSNGVKVLEEGIPVTTHIVNSQNDSLIEIFQDAAISMGSTIMTKIEVDGVLFKSGKWHHLRNFDDSTVIVGIVQHIILDGTSVALISEEHTAAFLKDVGIFVIKDPIRVTLIPITKMRYPVYQCLLMG